MTIMITITQKEAAEIGCQTLDGPFKGPHTLKAKKAFEVCDGKYIVEEGTIAYGGRSRIFVPLPYLFKGEQMAKMFDIDPEHLEDNWEIVDEKTL